MLVKGILEMEMKLQKLDSININVPNSPEFIQLLRLTVSGVASKMNFNIEDINEIKIIIEDICDYLTEKAQLKRLDINFEVYDKKLVLCFNKVADLHLCRKDIEKLCTTLAINKYIDKVKCGKHLCIEKNLPGPK